MLAEDLRQLLAELKIKRTHYVGLSMGGMIGQVVALTRPGRVRPRGARRHRARADRRRRRSNGRSASRPPRRAACSRWCSRRSSAGSPRRSATSPIVKKIGELIGSTPVPGYVGCCHAISNLNTTARLKDIRNPVLAITGEQDAAAPGTRYIGENVPGAKLVVIAQARAHRQPRAARGLQSRSGGVPFIPCQRSSLAECTPKRSSTRATLCATRSSSDFGLA